MNQHPALIVTSLALILASTCAGAQQSAGAPACDDPDTLWAVKDLFAEKLLAAGADTRARQAGLLREGDSLVTKFENNKAAALETMKVSAIKGEAGNLERRRCSVNIYRASDPSLVVPTSYTVIAGQGDTFDVKPNFSIPSGTIGFNLIVAFQTELLRGIYARELGARK